ncbi:LOW QUALITY PROTEIN: electroneutral sodium bicarbonate exchanger 1-like [Babylonia areolata]|uniref:LOW QUALITY PROTEIN: electroneutral sodium bicarbonate exchanger 1-like n=1 Tax=Babylonia areolata TaxID=304850 RepID=UPI003FD64616
MDALESNQPMRDHGFLRDVDYTDADFNADSHRAEYMHLRLPKRPRRPHKGHSKRRNTDRNHTENVTPAADPEPVFIPASLTPSEQIQLLLVDGDEGHTSPRIFCQMDVLHRLADVFQWRETARWVKYEEDVEEGGERWSKPHVASLSLHSLFELRSGLTLGGVVLDMDAHNISQVADLLMDHLVNKKLLEEGMRAEVRAAFIAPHVFQHNKYRSTRRQSTPDGVEMFGRRMSMKRTFSEIGRSLSIKRDSQISLGRVRGNPNSQPNLEMLNGDIPESASSSKLNMDFMRKIPDGAEAANILIGELDSLKYQVVAFIRLCEARNIGELTEVPLPTRFIFFMLGPKGSQSKNVEIGRSISTIMVDEVFREVAYKAKTRQDVLAGVDEFLDQVTALPPGEWDPKIRIEPPQSVPSQEQRKAPPQPPGEEKEEEEEESHCDPTLVRSGRLFGGLIEDVKRKLPWYASDFKDGLHIQCVASIIFLYLATLTPNVTFGGLLGQATDQYMGTMECIFTASIVGVLFALFAGQPLNILGSTGPMLVLEMILYRFCDDNKLDFLPFRCWIGIWTTALLLIIVAFDLSALVRYITRFTEESFASLIAFIFIAEAFKKLFGILELAPINTDPGAPLDYNCTCVHPNSTNFTTTTTMDSLDNVTSTMMTSAVTTVMTTLSPQPDNVTENITDSVTEMDWASLSKKMCKKMKGLLVGSGCDTPEYKADVFFLSFILFFVTYIVASTLSRSKNSSFFPTFVRQTLSDFAVLIAILIAVGIDAAIGLPTPKLEVPVEFKPTRDDRGWLVNPWSNRNPWWLTLAASVPALLAVILIFMDQQITAVIVNRKENKLKKGNGYHLDLFVLAITILICSFLGLPWYVAATVSALAHIMSLKKESECTAPGERPTFLGVREQRVTALMVGLLSGLSVLFTSVLKFIPMAVLYGVFLYMGMAALRGMQFIDRILVVFKPAKYQPDYSYLRHVPIKRVHIFTAIQVVCLAVLWVIKSVKSVSIIFPIMVLGTGFVRKGMDYIFTQRELKWLDDLMPDAAKKEKEDAKKLHDDQEDEEEEREKQSLLGGDEAYDRRLMEIKIQHDRLGEGKFGQRFTRRASLDTDRVNITEELTRTAMWAQLRNNSAKPADPEDPASRCEKRRRHRDRTNGNAKKSAAFYLQGDEDHKNTHADC